MLFGAAVLNVGVVCIVSGIVLGVLEGRCRLCSDGSIQFVDAVLLQRNDKVCLAFQLDAE